MKLSSTLMLTVLGLLNLTAYAPQPVQFTDGKLNGRGWIGLRNEHRTMYVTGVRDAMKYYDDTLKRDTKIGSDSAGMLGVIHVPALNNGELSEAVTDFYADATNRNIPVIASFAWVGLKVGGASQRDLAGYAAALRGAYNQ